MDVIIPFTFKNETTGNKIAGITHIVKKETNTNYNNTPFHYVFAHATGFCKEVFGDLVKQLRVRGVVSPITAIDHANHGDSTKHLPCSWTLLANDLYAVVDNVIRKNDPNKILIGVGHSMGGTVLVHAENEHPGTFGCLILLEPVLPMGPVKRSEKTDLSEMALKRRAVFPDKESVKKTFSAKPPFNIWTKLSLDNYIEYGFTNAIVDGKSVVELKAPKELEAEFYRMGSAQDGYYVIQKLSIPLLVLQGTKSTFPIRTYDSMISKCKRGYFAEVEGGTHFFPMEQPNVVAEQIINFTKTHLKTSLESKL